MGSAIGEVFHFGGVGGVVVQFRAAAAFLAPFGVAIPRGAEAVAGGVLRQCIAARCGADDKTARERTSEQ